MGIEGDVFGGILGLIERQRERMMLEVVKRGKGLGEFYGGRRQIRECCSWRNRIANQFGEF